MQRRIILSLIMASVFLVVTTGIAQQKSPSHPGAEPYTPSRIEWLATVLQANLRTERLTEDGFTLNIVMQDQETISIYVRYLPTVNREIMNIGIESARYVIQITAKSYGWDKWLKVKENIQMYQPDKSK